MAEPGKFKGEKDKSVEQPGKCQSHRKQSLVTFWIDRDPENKQGSKQNNT